MELDELKKALNQRMIAVPQQRSEEAIASLLQKDAVSVVQKLRRSLWAEMVVAVLFTIFCGVMIVADVSWAYDIYFSIFTFIGLAFIGVLYILTRKTSAVSADSPVKQNLENIIVVIREYTRRYLQLTVVLLPVCFAFAVWLSYNDPGKVPKPIEWDTIAYLSVGWVIAGTGFYYFTKWYLRKLYGNYLQQLQSMLSDFNEQSPEV